MISRDTCYIYKIIILLHNLLSETVIAILFQIKRDGTSLNSVFINIMTKVYTSNILFQRENAKIKNVKQTLFHRNFKLIFNVVELHS